MPVRVDPTLPSQRAAEQSVRLPPSGALTGWASLHLHGATYLDGLLPDGSTLLPVPLALGARGNIRASADVILLREPLGSSDVVLVRGIRCTRPERAAFDAMRFAPDLVEAVVVVDMAMEADLTSIARMRDYVARHPGWRGVRQARAGLDLADEHSWSPNETRTRMVWRREAGLPPPLVNQPIFDRRGRLLGFPDLLDVESGLVCEYDGADHRRASRHAQDIGREDTFRRHRLEVTRVAGPDLRSPGVVPRRLREARARAPWLPEQDRPWTVTPPAGWDAGPTLEMRLVERELLSASRAG